MRPLIVRLAAALLTVAVLPRPADATFPVLPSARTLPPGAADASLTVGYGNIDPDFWTALAGVRQGLLRGVEVGARGGGLSLDAVEGREAALLGGLDARVQVLRESIDIPVDFAVGVAWTVARPDGDTWSELSFTALFGKRVRAEWLDALVGDRLGAVVGAQLAFLSGSARPGRDESAAYGVAGVEIALPAAFTLVPEAKFGSHTVLGLTLRYRF